jgi:glycosyltransferase involved in cell wall biosynthesis
MADSDSLPREEDAPAGRKGSVLYVGHCYYNTWYLSRALRKRGWRADTLNLDTNPESKIFYHGEDFAFRPLGAGPRAWLETLRQFGFYLWALRKYDIFHFTGVHGLRILSGFENMWKLPMPDRWDVKLIKRLGKKIVYTNVGCLDGVAQSSFRAWPPEPVCDSCSWLNAPTVCSDELNLGWGKLRNSLADYQVAPGGNRKDYNDDPRVHEDPEFGCLDPDFWHPDLMIPTNYRLPIPEDTVKIYHAVGNFALRSHGPERRTIKSTHIYLPLIERLKTEGHKVELIFFHDVPNTELRYYMAQADIVVDMLTYGYFGATVREALMLGKPAVCFLRPEWLESMRREVPDYVDELPVISATPRTVHAVLTDLIENPEKRREVGRKSREFALKWHSAEAAAKRFEQIYSSLLRGLSVAARDRGARRETYEITRS